MRETTNTYALITGASQGLGRAIAVELARRKTNLLLVALPGEGLVGFAAQLADYQIDIQCFELDLSLRDNVVSLAETVNQRFALHALINNAGKGGTQHLEAVGFDYLDGILQLNIMATALLTQLLLRNLRQQKKAFILNVSSMAAFSPIAFKTVYPASKSFVRHFSLGLREELRGTGVSVSVVYPGPMKTNADATQRIESQGFKGRIGLLTVEEVALISIRAMLSGKANIVPGFANKLNRWLMAILPQRMVTRMVSKAVAKEIGR